MNTNTSRHIMLAFLLTIAPMTDATAGHAQPTGPDDETRLEMRIMEFWNTHSSRTAWSDICHAPLAGAVPSATLKP